MQFRRSSCTAVPWPHPAFLGIAMACWLSSCSNGTRDAGGVPGFANPAEGANSSETAVPAPSTPSDGTPGNGTQGDGTASDGTPNAAPAPGESIGGSLDLAGGMPVAGPNAPPAQAGAGGAAPVGAGGAPNTPELPNTTNGLSVLTNRYDNARSGANGLETVLTTANVNRNQFGLLFSRQVDALMYAQPLVVADLSIADNDVRDVVYSVTERNSVYAFDAADAGADAPIWQRNLGPSGPTAGFGCTDMIPEVGITSTPVIDREAGNIYVVAKGQENGNWVQRLHALDLRTGAERPGSPIVIAASVPGTGAGSVNGMVSFNAQTALNRPGLLLEGGTVYMAFASHCDFGPYHGWVLGYTYDATGLHQTRVFNVSPNGSAGGIWQAGVGLSSDGTSIFTAVGNGSSNPTSNPVDASEAVVRISLSDFRVADYWLPTAYAALNRADSDLSTGAVLMPYNMVLTGSKDGRLYVLDRNNLGGYNAGGDRIIQTLTTPGKSNGERGHLHGGPIYYNVPNGGGEWLYLWPEEGPLIGYRMDPTTHRLQVPFVQSNVYTPGHPGGILSLSSNAGTAGSGVLWASIPQQDAWHETQPGTLYAFDAADISKVLWSSEQNAARDRLGNFAKFSPPVVANGRVYISTFSNQLKVYGLLN
jgi:hypothetical protein